MRDWVLATCSNTRNDKEKYCLISSSSYLLINCLVWPYCRYCLTWCTMMSLRSTLSITSKHKYKKTVATIPNSMLRSSSTRNRFITESSLWKTRGNISSRFTTTRRGSRESSTSFPPMSSSSTNTSQTLNSKWPTYTQLPTSSVSFSLLPSSWGLRAWEKSKKGPVEWLGSMICSIRKPSKSSQTQKSGSMMSLAWIKAKWKSRSL